ncbi:ribonuclease HI family protein [Candidatus Peregrinibacteria bacterium]|nr:ribonuclease HI family protein [Candidatus Peregrinibacteria bacterium]
MIDLFVDGGARGNPGLGGGGFVVFRDGKIVLKGERFFGKVTNNQAEYQALIHALKQVKEKIGTPEIRCFMDSQLVVEQLNGRYKVKSPNVKPLFLEVQQLIGQFGSFTVSHVPREENALADALANEAMYGGEPL